MWVRMASCFEVFGDGLCSAPIPLPSMASIMSESSPVLPLTAFMTGSTPGRKL